MEMNCLISYTTTCVISIAIILHASVSFHRFWVECLRTANVSDSNFWLTGTICGYPECKAFFSIFGSAEAVIYPISHFVLVFFWIVHLVAYRKTFAFACNAMRICSSRGVFFALARLRGKLGVKRMSSRVHHVFQQQRILFGKKMLSFVPHVLLIVVTTNHFASIEIWTTPGDEAAEIFGTRRSPSISIEEHMHAWQMYLRAVVFPFSGCYAVCMVLKLSHLTPAKLNCANIILSSLWAWRYLHTDQKWYQYNALGAWVFRFGGSLMLGNAKLSIMLQLVLSVVDTIVYYVRFAAPFDTAVIQFVNVHTDEYAVRGRVEGYWGYVVVQLLLFTAIAGLTWACEGLMISQAEALVEAKRSLQVSTRVRRLLSGMCDVVVQLNENLELVEPCPKLGHMLLHASPDSLAKSSLLDLVTAADRERFQNYIRNEIECQKIREGQMIDQSPPSPLHTSFLDASATPVAVEIFISYCPDINGDHNLLLGILQEEGRVPEAPEIVSNLPFHDLQRTAKRESGIESCSASDCSHGSMIDYTVVCSIFTKGFPIETCSIAFGSLCGSGQICKGTPFLDIVGKPEAFKEWVQACVNNFGLESSHVVDSKTITIPVEGNPFLELKCRCRMDDTWDLDDPQHVGLARFVFENISVRQSSFKYRCRTGIRQRALECRRVEL